MDKEEKSKEKKRIRRVRLTDAADVKRYLGWLARRVEAGVFDTESAKTINSLMRTLLKAVEMGQLADLETRLTELERLAGEKR
jgi:hypothetical protein